MGDHLRHFRLENILTVFRRIRLWLFQTCGLVPSHTSAASSRRI